MAWLKTVFFFFTALLLSLSSYRCSDDTTGADASGLCVDDEQCPWGQYCSDGICVDGQNQCDDSNPCPDGSACRNGACVSTDRDGGLDGDGGMDGGDVETDHGPDIEISSPAQSAGVYQLDFGNVLVGVMVEREVVVENVGDEDLRILDLNFESGTDLDDFSLDEGVKDSLPLVVAPQQQATIPVRYKATDATTDHSILDIISNDPDEALVKIHLLSEFKGEQKIAVSKESIDFGDVPLGQASEPLGFSISNQGSGNAVLSVDDVRLAVVNNEDFDLEVVDIEQQQVELPALLNNGDVLDVTVTYHPQIREQDSDRVLIVSNDPNSPTAQVDLLGRGVVGDVTVEPSPVNLGRIRVGESGTKDITITNSGGASVELTSVQLVDTSDLWSVDSSELDLQSLPDTPYALDPGQLVHAQVSYSARSTGPETGTLNVAHTGPSGQLQVVLSAEGYIPAHATLDPLPPLVFLDVQYDQASSTAESRTLTLDVGNDGGQPLLVSSVHLANSSPEFTWQNEPVSVSPGQYQRMSITYTPDSSGSVNDRLYLETNDPDAQYDGVDGRVDVELQANAIDPAMVVIPTGIQDFGQVLIGEAQVVSITILSASPDPLQVLGIELSGGSSADYSLAGLPDLSVPIVGQGSSVSFQIVYSPTDSGADTGQVVITSSDIGNPLVRIDLVGSSPGCPDGWGDCDVSVPGCETQLNTLDDCGACDTPCSLAHADSTCETGTCKVAGCIDPWGDCDDLEPGCETDLSSDPEHCLLCDNACSFDNANPVCTQTGCQMGDCLDDYWNLDGSSVNGCEYHCVYQSPVDEPDASFADNNCDGIDGDILGAIFVSPLGLDSNPGTMAQPVRTISHGITLAASAGFSQVLVAAGTYSEDSTLVLVRAVGVFGGYDPITWARQSGNIPSISVSSATAVSASAISSTTVMELLRFQGDDAASSGQSAYGLRASDSDGLVIRSCEFHAGLGGNGMSGSSPSGVADSGSNGSAGQSGCEDSSGFCASCSRPQGGAGGTSSCGRSGGRGGNAGHGSGSGYSGSTGVGATPGGPGTPDGHGNWNTPSDYWGHDGADGPAGANGMVGGFAFTSTGYTTAAGLGGSDGTHGNGGGGGGGGGGGTANCDSYGGGGGGGGAGGCGGLGGGGGTSAGGSFAVYLWNSSVQMSNCTLVTAGGGTGGSGGVGQPGGSGGEGGHGSLSGAGNGYGGGDEQDDGSNGGRGGWGGHGGRGGHGGGGAGGCSIGIVAGGTSNPDLVGTNYSIGSAGAGGASLGFAGPDGLQANTYHP